MKSYEKHIFNKSVHAFRFKTVGGHLNLFGISAINSITTSSWSPELSSSSSEGGRPVFRTFADGEGASLSELASAAVLLRPLRFWSESDFFPTLYKLLRIIN